MRQLIFLFFFCSISLWTQAQTSTATTAPATAKIGDFIISCENVNRNLETGESELSGNVQIIYKEQRLSADMVKIDQKNNTASFDGNVVISNTSYEIGGDHVDLNYDQNTAHIINGYVKSNNVFFTGRTIEQLRTNEFVVEDATYTACSNCPPTWGFSGSKIEATIGGYAYLKNAFLRLSGIPVLWLPYFLVPLKSERQTGLLTPEIGATADRGFYFSQSLFVALSRSQDITLNLANYRRGGLKEQIEYRHALSTKSSGTFTGSHMADSEFSSNKRYKNFTPTTDLESRYNRWSLRGYNEYSPSANEKWRLSVNQISDLQYPKDFFRDFTNYADSGLENRINYTSTTDNTSLSFDGIYFKHMLAADALSDNSMAVHRLPEIKFDSTLKRLGRSQAYYKFNFNYANFYRERAYDDIAPALNGQSQKYVANGATDPRCENGYPDAQNGDTLDPNRMKPICNPVYDGQYNEGTDVIRTGQRLLARGTILTPALSLGDVINISPEISYNEAHYLFPAGEHRYNTKHYLEFDMLSRSKLYRVYESEEQKYKHEFIPELSYRWIPWIQEDVHPFFGQPVEGNIPVLSKATISDPDLNQNSIQYDYNDRVYDRNLITLTLLNRVVRKTNSTQAYKNIFDFQLKQSYDLYQALYGKNKEQPLSALYSNMNLYIDDFTFSNESYYYPYVSATDSSTTMTYLNSLQQYFKLGLISKRTSNPKSDDVSVALGFVTSYINLLTGVILDTSANRSSDSRIKKVSLITQIKPPGECWAINFYREQKIGSDPEYHINFAFSWDGKPIKVIPPNELNIN